MNDAERKERDAKIEAMFHERKPTRVIARAFQLRPARVITILNERGVRQPSDNQGAHTREIGGVWEMLEQDRRHAIWERQREGATKALKS